ncbi:MAG TPA: bifunctional glycosyltransferase/class I SAM-dependent methyltransferase [Candidatus Sulfotelmatobacter sp.]|nr:bifunctional glycosyltransferase/class I SAM-dependent methyltransferase [Candidatus Sulfotelmatobacter sp.]
MASKLSLAVVVPVYNEQYLVEASLRRLEVLAESPWLERVRVIVVNDASTDQTAKVLRRFREGLGKTGLARLEWIFAEHETNQGKGAAIRTALEHADTDLTVIHDADLEYHPQDLLEMIPLFAAEEADAVYGSRFLAGDYRRVLFFRHSLGNKLLTLLTDFVTDLNLTDMETCYKMIRTELLKSIPLESQRFGFEPEITIKLAKREARIFELPIRYSGRTYAEGKKITWKDGAKALGALLKYGISDRIYVADEHGSEILARLNRAPRFTKWMADTIRPYLGERILEIGAGIGNLTANLVPRTVYWASDVNPQYLDRLEKLKATRPYLRVSYTDATAGESYPAEEFDTVICLNVVEHLEDDVKALRNIRASLEKNGRAIILVPNGPGLYGTLDEVLGHYRRYTRDQLVEVCGRAGFRVEKVLKFNRIGSPGWWWNGRILKKKTFGFWQIKLLNALVPVVRPIDRFLPFPHLSWIVILRRGEETQGQESPARADGQSVLTAQGNYPQER